MVQDVRSMFVLYAAIYNHTRKVVVILYFKTSLWYNRLIEALVKIMYINFDNKKI